ncbi:MAG: biotin transporter BioY [Parvibaculaceae bacterium]
MTTPTTTLASRVWQVSGSWKKQALLVVLGSLFIAICAQISIELPLVPVTMQTFAVLAVGAAFGLRLGAATVALYLLEGTLGLPVFQGFAAGPAVMMGPTGGYLIGFVLAAALVGWFAERGFDRRVLTMFGVMMLGAAVLYVPGLLWLANFTGYDKVLELGLYPFLWGDLMKAALAAVAFPTAWSFLGKR